MADFQHGKNLDELQRPICDMTNTQVHFRG